MFEQLVGQTVTTRSGPRTGQTASILSVEYATNQDGTPYLLFALRYADGSLDMAVGSNVIMPPGTAEPPAPAPTQGK